MDGFTDQQVVKQQQQPQQFYQSQPHYGPLSDPPTKQQQQYQTPNQQPQTVPLTYANQQSVQSPCLGESKVVEEPLIQQQQYPSTSQQPQLHRQQHQTLVYANQGQYPQQPQQKVDNLIAQFTNQPQVTNQLRQQQQQMPLTMSYAQSGVPMPNTVGNGIVQSQYGVGDISMTLANNAAVGGYGGRAGLFGSADGGSDGNRQAADFNKFDVEPKQALADLITADLKDHWAQVEKLNLIDADHLDQLFVYHDVLDGDKKFLFEYLYSEYREKYTELFKQYLSVEIYVIYVLLMLVYGSEQILKEACSDGYNGSTQTPRAGGTSLKLRQFTRKRVTADADGGDNAAKRTRVTAEGSVAAENTATTTVDHKHPFFGEKLYRAHSSLFKVGEMAKYCVPSEFAILFCSVQLGTVCVYAQGDRKTQHNGLRLLFSRPVVSLVRSRNFKSYTFQSLERFGGLVNLMETVTGRTTDQEPFRLSSLKEMKMKDLTTQLPLTTLNWDSNVGYNMAVINTFSCTDTNVGILNIRSFSSPIYHVAKGHIDVDEERLKKMTEKASNDRSCERRTNELNEYYDRVEEGEPVASERTPTR